MRLRYSLYILLLVGIIFGQNQIPKLDKYATDFTNTLSGNEINFLNRDLYNFYDTTSNQLVFLMISSLNDYPMENYTYEVATQNKIGTKENNNGVLLFVAKNDRKMRIETGYGLEGALPDALANSIIRNEIAPYFRNDDYYGGVSAGLNAIKLATMGEYQRDGNDDEEDGGGLPVVFIIIFIILFLISSRGKGRGSQVASSILLGTLLGGSRGGGGSYGGGGSFGGGGFSGGGGSFGGGGSSGGW